MSYCQKCGAALTYPSAQQPMDWREERRQMRAERRARGGSRFGGLVIATILIVAGLGVFFPDLPWEAFWGGLLILLGIWVAVLWGTRGHGYTSHQRQTAPISP